MSLIPLISPAEIAAAHTTIVSNLRRGCVQYRRVLGWPGGNLECDLDWNSRARFWFSANPFPDNHRWLTFFGGDDPADRRMLGIIFEANFPKGTIDRRCAGVFVRDDSDGSTYFAHSGKIGGGRKGIGKSAFLSQYRSCREEVTWSKHDRSEVIVIGRIDSEHLPAQVASFMHEVQRFKAGVSGKGNAANEPPAPLLPPQEFTPEFSGQRQPYQFASTIESRCDHGAIVNTLARVLEESGLVIGNDASRDLYVSNGHGRMKILFEAKTAVTTSTIYQAIGQLIYHSSAEKPPPKLVMVLPEAPDGRTRGVLEKLGIAVLRVGWQSGVPNFENLGEILAPEKP
jgi:hypothetical protein